MTSAITRTLHKPEMESISGVDVVTAHDPSCKNWIKKIESRRTCRDCNNSSRPTDLLHPMLQLSFHRPLHARMRVLLRISVRRVVSNATFTYFLAKLLQSESQNFGCYGVTSSLERAIVEC